MTAETSVLVVLQPKLFRLSLGLILSDQLALEKVADAGTGMEALSIMASSQAQIAIVDPLVPGGGANLIQALHLSNPRSAIVAVCRPRDRDSVVSYLQAGGCSFVDPDSTIVEIVHAVERALAGETIIPARVSSLLSSNDATVRVPGTTSLSKRELEVVREVALGKSNQEVARELRISENTVKGHLVSIFSKLHLTNRVQLANIAIEFGLADGAESRHRLRSIS